MIPPAPKPDALFASSVKGPKTQLTFSRVHWAEPEIFCAHCNSAAKHRHFMLLAHHLACLISLLSNVLKAPTAYLSLCVDFFASKVLRMASKLSFGLAGCHGRHVVWSARGAGKLSKSMSTTRRYSQWLRGSLGKVRASDHP